MQLTHLYVLIPVLDNDKHYWVGNDEIEKLLKRGEGWLQQHPEKEMIVDRYLKRQRALVPVIRQLAERLELHLLRSGNPQTGPIFANQLGKPLAMVSLTNRFILPSLNVCEQCGKPQAKHLKATQAFRRDEQIPAWQGWHAARRGLRSNLYRLGVPDMVIQRILRHANVSTTATYYIKTAAADVRSAMTKLENHIVEAGKLQRDTGWDFRVQFNNCAVAYKLFIFKQMAERGGFEPPVELLTLQRFSKPPPSATRPSLRLTGIILEGAPDLRSRDSKDESREGHFVLGAAAIRC
jgi:hypothetical protein